MLSRRFSSRTLSTLLILALAPSGTLGSLAQTPECRDLAFQSGSGKQTQSEVVDAGLKIVSLNMARSTRAEKIVSEIQEAPSLVDADVWLLQEAAERVRANEETVREVAEALGLNYVFAPADELEDGDLLSGLGIMSRYPIGQVRRIRLTQHNLKFNTRCRIALETTVESPAGAIRFYNVHLDTRISSGQRLDQLRPVFESGTAWPGPVVVAGDFNTVNIRWVWNLVPLPLAQNHHNPLREVFLQNGFESPLEGAGGTFKVFGLSLRLDWIFPKGLKPLAAGVQDLDFSDHDAPWVELSLRPEVAASSE
jgi:endonuclease/exonuclease/phosphatase family metal-dependent hydrolase